MRPPETSREIYLQNLRNNALESLSNEIRDRPWWKYTQRLDDPLGMILLVHTTDMDAANAWLAEFGRSYGPFRIKLAHVDFVGDLVLPGPADA